MTKTRGATPRSRRNAAAREQLACCSAFSLVGYLATLLVVFILGAILWDDLARPALFAWFVAISHGASGATSSTRRTQAADADRGVAWERRFHRRHRARGLCWARSAPCLLPSHALVAAPLGGDAGDAAHDGRRGLLRAAPLRYKITAFLGLVPLAVTLGHSGDRNQMFISG
jgi:hypothetical protein